MTETWCIVGPKNELGGRGKKKVNEAAIKNTTRGAEDAKSGEGRRSISTHGSTGAALGEQRKKRKEGVSELLSRLGGWQEKPLKRETPSKKPHG